MQGIRSIKFGWAGVLILFAVWTVSSVWLVGLVPVAEWIPIAVSGVGLLIALAVSVWNVSEQRRLAQMNFAVTLWGQWAEESMLKARNTAWDAIAGLPVVDRSKESRRTQGRRSGERSEVSEHRPRESLLRRPERFLGRRAVESQGCQWTLP